MPFGVIVAVLLIALIVQALGRLGWAKTAGTVGGMLWLVVAFVLRLSAGEVMVLIALEIIYSEVVVWLASQA
jgi:hypothetical protein